MQSSENAGIIVYQESRLPKLLSSISKPRLEVSISINIEEEEHIIFIFFCPVNSDKLDRKRYKLLKELVDKNHVKFLVEKFEAKVQSNVTKKRLEIHYSDILPEISAMKQLAVLLKKSQDSGENLLNRKVGFIMGEPDLKKIDMLTEEAESVMLYECPTMTEKLKWQLHNDLMEKKGISIVFTKDLGKIITDSDILSVDDRVDLSMYAGDMKYKVVLGNSGCADIAGIYEIVLWHKDIKAEAARALLTELNNEILAIIRYFYIKLDIIEFIKKLPYIYF